MRLIMIILFIGIAICLVIFIPVIGIILALIPAGLAWHLIKLSMQDFNDM